MKNTLPKRATLQTRIHNGQKELICDACLGPYADFEHPLFLAANGMTGEGKRASVHSRCYTEELAKKLTQ